MFLVWGAQNILSVDMSGDYMGVHFMQNALSYIFMFYAFFYIHIIFCNKMYLK